METLVDPTPFPAWQTPEDLDDFTANLEAGGFRGPLSRYRNQDRDFATLPEMGAAPLAQPSCLIAGAKDTVRRFVPNFDPYADVANNCPDLRASTIIDGAGHWVQQEAPQQVTAALLEVLASLA